MNLEVISRWNISTRFSSSMWLSNVVAGCTTSNRFSSLHFYSHICWYFCGTRQSNTTPWNHFQNWRLWNMTTYFNWSTRANQPNFSFSPIRESSSTLSSTVWLLTFPQNDSWTLIYCTMCSPPSLKGARLGTLRIMIQILFCTANRFHCLWMYSLAASLLLLVSYRSWKFHC